MPTNSPIPDELTDPPPRFGVRYLLGLTTVVALAAAWFAPTLRSWEPERWGVFARVLAVYLFAAACGWSVQAFLLRRARRRAGRQLLWLSRVEAGQQVRSHSATLSAAPRPVGFVVAVSLLVLISFAETERLPLPSEIGGYQATYFGRVCWGLVIGVACWYSTKPRSLLSVGLGELGVFVAADMQSYAWESVRIQRWPLAELSETLSLRVGDDDVQWIDLKVPFDRRSSVIKLLAERLPPEQLFGRDA